MKTKLRTDDGRKLDKDGNVRRTIGLKPEIDTLLREIANIEHRSDTAELSHLVVERAREMGLDTSRHLGKK